MKSSPSTEDPRAPRDRRDAVPVKLVAAAAALATILVVVSNVLFEEQPLPARHFNFTGAVSSPTGFGFALPTEAAGAWTVEDDEGATGGRVLVNHPGTSGERAALALVGQPRSADVRLATRCRSGREGGGCGVVWRLRDLDHHYLARIEPHADRVVLAVVMKGVERTIGTSSADLADGWHHLAVEAIGTRMRVSVDGTAKIEASDKTLIAAGSKGLWAPPLESAVFDLFTISPLMDGVARPTRGGDDAS
jgi:hypothetical protein